MRRRSLHLPAFSICALTLGEMLVVLAVFIILAIIFILSSTQAMVKTKISRTLQETQMLSRALANYEADSSSLPGLTPGLRALTGSVKYLVRLPVDPFSESTQNRGTYGYLARVSDQHRALVISVGPDGDSDLLANLQAEPTIGPSITSKSLDANVVMMSVAEADKIIAEHSYDPTNGIVSDGDVITIYR